MIRLHRHAILVLEAVRHPVGGDDNDGILGQRQRLVVDTTVGSSAYQMRIGCPKAVGNHGTVVGQHGVEPPPITCHHVGDGHPNAPHESQLIGTRIEGSRRGHSSQFGAVHDPLLCHWNCTVQVQVHGQLLLVVVGGAYHMRNLIR